MPTCLPPAGSPLAEVVVGHDVDGSAFVGEIVRHPSDDRFVGACNGRDLEVDAPTLAGALLLARLRYPEGICLCSQGLAQLARESGLSVIHAYGRRGWPSSLTYRQRPNGRTEAGLVKLAAELALLDLRISEYGIDDDIGDETTAPYAVIIPVGGFRR